MTAAVLAVLAVLANTAASVWLGWDLGRRRAMSDALEGPVWDTAYRLGQAMQLYRIESEITGVPVTELIDRDQQKAGDR